MLYSCSCMRACASRPSFLIGKRRASVRSWFHHPGFRRMPRGTLPKLPTVGLSGCGIVKARGLKCGWSSSGRFGSRVISKIGSPVSMHANVAPGVSVGLVLAIPGLLVVQAGCVAVPLRYFVTPDTCQSPRIHLTTGVLG